MNNLTQIKREAKDAFLNNQQDQMLSLYEKADRSERNAIIKHVDSFLSTCNSEEKLFWLKFRRRLEVLNERTVLFPLGNIYMTIGAREAMKKANQEPFEFLARHQRGDWGIVCKEDAKENEFSVKNGFRILSAYKTNLAEKIWILTESNRSASTILIPEEY